MSQEKPTGAFGGFMGAIKGALFEDEAAKSGKSVNSGNPGNGPQAKLDTASVPGQAGAASIGTADIDLVAVNLATEKNSMVASMMQVVMSKATAYTALEEALAPLEKYIPDEGSRFKAAFDIVGKTRTIEQIVQAIEMQHMQALQDEAQRFNGQAQGKQDQEITARLNEADVLRNRITAAKEDAERFRKQTDDRLKMLEEEVASNTGKILTIEKEVAEKRAAIERVNAQFNAAVSVVRGHLTQAKAKVLKYLAG